MYLSLIGLVKAIFKRGDIRFNKMGKFQKGHIPKSKGIFKEPSDLIGKRFGRLTVIKFSRNHFAERKTGKRVGVIDRIKVWLCKCDCGNISEHMQHTIKSGNAKSCGCIQREHAVYLGKKGTHLLSHHPLFKIWIGIKRRCLETSHKSYKDYGGRGILICNEWADSFKCFYDWSMNNGFKKGLTVERKNNNGNYEPKNCTFIPKSKQPQNRRNTKLTRIRARHIRIMSKDKTNVDIAKLYCVSQNTVIRIIKNKSWI